MDGFKKIVFIRNVFMLQLEPTNHASRNVQSLPRMIKLNFFDKHLKYVDVCFVIAFQAKNNIVQILFWKCIGYFESFFPHVFKLFFKLSCLLFKNENFVVAIAINNSFSMLSNGRLSLTQASVS